VAASAYIDRVVDPSGPLTSADIETVARKPADRLGRDRVFPHSFERGPWSAKAAADWLASMAARSTGVARLNACDRLPLFVLLLDHRRAAPKRWLA
jgi:hypothetical protein